MAIIYHNQECTFTLKNKTRISAWIRATAAEEGFAVSDLSVVFCSDAVLLEINRKYLDHDYFTDIITFDYTENSAISGDLMISVDTVRSNSQTLGVTFENELLRVIIHGVLHLCGHGDKDPLSERKMRLLEDKYLEQL